MIKSISTIDQVLPKELLSFFYTAALQSVFPQTELGTFMSLTKRDKERQLQELTLIVSGIRLFNKECGKGGEGIDDCESVQYVFILYVTISNYKSVCAIIKLGM